MVSSRLRRSAPASEARTETQVRTSAASTRRRLMPSVYRRMTGGAWALRYRKPVQKAGQDAMRQAPDRRRADQKSVDLGSLARDLYLGAPGGLGQIAQKHPHVARHLVALTNDGLARK